MSEVEQLDLFPDMPTPSPAEMEKEPNKMRKHLGPGPEGTTCGTCRYLYRKKWGGTYFKCELYGDSNGPGTDFRKKWQSCRKYEAREDVNGY
jgi:hypothetical protein